LGDTEIETNCSAEKFVKYHGRDDFKLYILALVTSESG
jgi:hypothetical protein